MTPEPEKVVDNPTIRYHLELIGEVLSSLQSPQGALQGAETAYFWNSPLIRKLETARLEFQNTEDGLWGKGHRQYHQQLKEALSLKPEDILAIGTGSDAILIKTLLEVYPSAEVTVVELDPEKIAEARATLEKTKPADIARLNFIQGNIANILPSLDKKFDLVDVQLLLVHLAERPPLTWSEEVQGPFPTLQKVLGVISGATKTGGLVTIGDPSLTRWDARVVAGFENDPEAQAKATLVHTFIHGNEQFPGAIETGWIKRGANAWKDGQHIAGVVGKHTQGQLKLLENPETRLNSTVDIVTFPDQKVVMPMHMLLLFTLQTQQSLDNLKKASSNPKTPIQTKQRIIQILPEMEKGVASLWQITEPCIRACLSPKVATVMPRMYWQAFVKQ